MTRELCVGCGESLEEDLAGHKIDAVAVWMRSPFGITCVHAHPGCEDRAAARLGYRRIPDPPVKGAPRHGQ